MEILRYGPLYSVWLCTMGHSAKFDSAQSVTAKDLVSHALGPKRMIWFCTLSHSAKYSYPRWANAIHIVIRCRLLWRFWLCSTGHCDEFGYTMSGCAEWTRNNLRKVLHCYSAGFNIALWGTAQYFSYAQLAIAQNKLPERRTTKFTHTKINIHTQTCRGGGGYSPSGKG
jgi:hypothetical protein